MLRQVKKGMTLIEMMIAIFIFTMGILGFTYMFGQAWKMNGFTLEEGQDAMKASQAVNNLVVELRRACQSAAGAYPIVSGTETDLVMYVDLNNDGIVERVHYYYNQANGQLMKGVTEPSGNPASYPNGDQTTTVFVDNVFNTGLDPVFYYYNSSYPADTTHNPLATPINPSDVRLIKVSLLINIRPITAPNNIKIESFAELRNINDYQQ